MTPQLKLVSAGAIATTVAKFGFGKDWHGAAVVGLITIAAIAILTAQSNQDAN